MTVPDESAAPVLRLAHFSDVHISVRPLGWQRRDFLSKRIAGYINHTYLGRRHRFRLAELVLAVLAKELRERQPDHLVFSGDATALGFEAEFAHAAALLGANDGPMPPGIAVPGNHDYYSNRIAAEGMFEHYFAAWQQGERIEDFTYPFAQRVGPVWLVAVNSCWPRWNWDATGRVGSEQLARLTQLLKRLDDRPRILVTHYPVVLADGKLEPRVRRLRDLKDVIRVAIDGGIGLWLHGHRHGAYHHQEPRLAPFPVICAGSATQHGYWSYGEYAIEGKQLRATRRVFDPDRGHFAEGDSFSLEISG